MANIGATGRVKYFNHLRGFGYILHELDDREIYFHYTSIAEQGENKDLREGMTVTYDVIETTMGPEASNVRRLALGL